MWRVIGCAILALGLVLSCGCKRQAVETPAPPVEVAQPQEQPVAHALCHRAPAPPVIDGRVDESEWAASDDLAFVQWNNEPAQSETHARVLWDDEFLYIAFVGDDVELHGTMTKRDENLWEEHEVYEVFLDADGTGQSYLEFEINPVNALVDLVLPYADKPRQLEGCKDWDSKGLQWATQVQGTVEAGEQDDTGWSVEMALPLNEVLDAEEVPPPVGTIWRLNLYRMDRTGEDTEFQAWSPTMTPKPNYHVPERFGKLEFAE